MNNAQELKAHLQDSNKARMYEVRKIEKKAIREEILSILEDYHYESDTENMSKDVVVALENLVKSRLLSEVNAEHKKKQKIYKCIRLNSNGEEFISYATTVDCYQLDAIEVNKINFKANDMERLCDELNNNETREVLDE